MATNISRKYHPVNLLAYWKTGIVVLLLVILKQIYYICKNKLFSTFPQLII